MLYVCSLVSSLSDIVPQLVLGQCPTAWCGMYKFQQGYIYIYIKQSCILGYWTVWLYFPFVALLTYKRTTVILNYFVATFSIQTQYSFLKPFPSSTSFLGKAFPGGQILTKSLIQCPSTGGGRHLHYLSKSFAKWLKVTSSICLTSRNKSLLTLFSSQGQTVGKPNSKKEV